MLLKFLARSLSCLAVFGPAQPHALGQPATPDSSAYPYFTLQLGAGFPDDTNGSFSEGDFQLDTRFSVDPGFNGEVGIGYRFNETFRSDITLGYGSFGGVQQTLSLPGVASATLASNSNIEYFTAMVNGYLDIPIRNRDGSRSRWSPYLGAGLGYGNLTVPDCSFSTACFSGGSGGGFAYQGKIGLSYRTTPQGSLFLEGAYTGFSGPTINGVDFDNFGAWRLNVGWRQRFGGASRTQVVAADQPAAQTSEGSDVPVVAPAPLPVPQPGQSQPIRGLW